MSILNFSDALEEANSIIEGYDGLGLHLFLGNGFSIACLPEKFEYTNLLEEANFGENDSNIKRIFDEFNTRDFEKIIKQLSDASKVLNHYNSELELSQKLQEETSIIREQLIQVLALKHPDTILEIQEYSLSSCISFLANFNNIFTTNYDLLLYWVLMKEKEDARSETREALFDMIDGFGWRNPEDRRLVWPRNFDTQNVFYLHGALHFVLNNYYETQKLQWNGFSSPLVFQIQQNLEDNKFPLFISEGSSKEKLEKIKQNSYLEAAFNKLKEIQGCLFIHGHSLDNDSDRHILLTIAENTNIKKVFISVHNPDQNLSTMISKASFLESLRRSVPRLDIAYYDAASARVWNNGSVIFREEQ